MDQYILVALYFDSVSNFLCLQETIQTPWYMLTWNNGLKNDIMGLSFEAVNGTKWATDSLVSEAYA
jgi:hypothetical protein